MKTAIIHARYVAEHAALDAREQLLRAGFEADHISVFSDDSTRIADPDRESDATGEADHGQTDSLLMAPDAHALSWRVAVAAPTVVQQCAVIDVLQAAGGHDLHSATGQLVGGTWIDFDPRDDFQTLDADTIRGLRESSANTD